MNDHLALVEPACGAPLSVIYQIDRFPELAKANSILVIVCGGVGISTQLLADYRQQFKV